MRGLGLMVALDALDTARRAQDAIERRDRRRAADIGPDGEPTDRLNDDDADARLSAWRAWARRRDLAEPPAADLVPRPGRQAGPSPTIS
jgi:hypothetical protein